jgi:hypothetical protein
MKPMPASPRDLDRNRLKSVLGRIDRGRPLPDRLEAASRAFRGRPYLTNPLVGSAEQPEVFTASLRAFDCVTYVETVLALAAAKTPAAFGERLRRIRYDGGRIDWKRRNHYMTDWVRRNARAGFVRPLRLPAETVTRRRNLNVLPGLRPRAASVRSIPKRAFWRVREAVATGDLLLFASTKRNRDVFHLGIAVRDGDTLRLRHASRSQKGVVEQDLAEFLKANTMAGVIVVRPT